MAAGMDIFHSDFRKTWDKIYATGSNGLHLTTADAFVRMILDWCERLNQHHRLEEEHVFPKLAARMPAFRTTDADVDHSAAKFAEGDTTADKSHSMGYIHQQHEEIHAGLDVLHDYVKAWTAEPQREVNWEEIRGMMDKFGTILWKHMDEEVEMLGAANMRLYWSLDEMIQLPFKVKD
ncbi:hypothetical protein BS50DRAFT_579868 [Corynespora cassiicola Philippines]|uniref:Hemerythrin-like domain-containing protein n=1 Tax=Corynespora cassiicola Philippines TaxID=1448308 RepID=A0A2T2N2G7_CORCC|nr:hypothetical protein BS50DRAFT_579868 [Corynespora cassiicola Philippines]